MSTKILLHVANRQAYVWDVKDISRLRAEHRVCGLLAGTLPRMSQQNIFLGVPLVLLPEEVVLLVENNAAILVDDKLAHNAPTPLQKATWIAEQERQRRIELALKEKSVHETSAKRASSPKATERRHERARLKATSEVKITNGQEEVSIESVNRDSEPCPTHPHQSKETAFTAPYSIKIPTSSTELAWYEPAKHCYSTIDAARNANIWAYPESAEQRARCGVYRSLWEKGYYMGCGIKFGGDFLVYPGDPLRYHSHFVASVLKDDASPIRPIEIVAHGRLGTATKKAHLFCSWNEKIRDADIYSVEWAGFG